MQLSTHCAQERGTFLLLPRPRLVLTGGQSGKIHRETPKREEPVHTNSLPSTAPTTATARLDTVFLEIREIGMTRSRVLIHRATAIIFWSLVLVPHNHGNWRSKRDTEFRARLDLDPVLFIPWRRESALTGSPTGHLRLDIGFSESHAWRAAIYDAADGAAV
jgi:hypothetical protein